MVENLTVPHLTETQKRILDLRDSNGIRLTYRGIADTLDMSEDSARSHVSLMRAKGLEMRILRRPNIGETIIEDILRNGLATRRELSQRLNIDPENLKVQLSRLKTNRKITIPFFSNKSSLEQKEVREIEEEDVILMQKITVGDVPEDVIERRRTFDRINFLRKRGVDFPGSRDWDISEPKRKLLVLYQSGIREIHSLASLMDTSRNLIYVSIVRLNRKGYDLSVLSFGIRDLIVGSVLKGIFGVGEIAKNVGVLARNLDMKAWDYEISESSVCTSISRLKKKNGITIDLKKLRKQSVGPFFPASKE